ncbi:MAG: response regulator [Patescibacteria group bacterium]
MSKILVVEDDHDLNKAYCLILKHAGHEVVAAFDGKEALEKLKGFEPELILLDLLMPVMGGLEFLQQWNTPKKNNHKDVKVLIFTNMENSPEVAEAYKLGAHRCIIKSWTAPHNLALVVSESLQPEAESAKTKTKTKAK